MGTPSSSRCALVATAPSICPRARSIPALHRLERAGLIASDWQTVGGRRRRAYHLTPAGHTALSEQRALWDQFSTAVTALLKRRTWPATA